MSRGGRKKLRQMRKALEQKKEAGPAESSGGLLAALMQMVGMSPDEPLAPTVESRNAEWEAIQAEQRRRLEEVRALAKAQAPVAPTEPKKDKKPKADDATAKPTEDAAGNDGPFHYLPPRGPGWLSDFTEEQLRAFKRQHRITAEEYDAELSRRKRYTGGSSNGGSVIWSAPSVLIDGVGWLLPWKRK